MTSHSGSSGCYGDDCPGSVCEGAGENVPVTLCGLAVRAVFRVTVNYGSEGLLKNPCQGFAQKVLNSDLLCRISTNSALAVGRMEVSFRGPFLENDCPRFSAPLGLVQGNLLCWCELWPTRGSGGLALRDEDHLDVSPAEARLLPGAYGERGNCPCGGRGQESGPVDVVLPDGD